MQNCCRNRLRIEMHVGQLLGDRNRVRYVGFTGFAFLPGVRLRTKLVSGGDVDDLFVRQVGLQCFHKTPYAMVALIGARQF